MNVPPSPDAARWRRVLVALGAVLLAAIALGAAAGSVPLPLSAIAGDLLRRAGLEVGLPRLAGPGEAIFWAVRLPRVLLAATVGGGLAVVGAALQAVFRNPLADSGLLGVGAGAALGAVAAVTLGLSGDVFLAVPFFAFVGALGAVGAVYVLAHLPGRPSLHGLLLTGLAVSALAGAGLSILLVRTEEFRVKVVIFWLAGGLEGRSWPHLAIGAAFILAGATLLVLLARPLDVLSLGEEEAAALGLPVHAARLGILGAAALVAGAATSVAGSVPFVGLVAPHALRPLVGSRAVRLLPASFLAGAVLVVLADVAARTVSGLYDLPLGSLTAIVGAPYFLLALRGQEGR
jgi:iron complex transport system permease protein